MENCDVFVMGAGPGGYPAAIRAAQRGLSVYKDLPPAYQNVGFPPGTDPGIGNELVYSHTLSHITNSPKLSKRQNPFCFDVYPVTACSSFYIA